MRINQKNQIDIELHNIVESGKRRFVIFPFGEFGVYTKSVLNNEYNITEELILDNFKKEEGVYPVEYLSDIQPLDSDIYFLITIENAELQRGMRNLLLQYVPDKQILILFDRTIEGNETIRSDERLAESGKIGYELMKSIACDMDKFYVFYSGPNGDLIAVTSLLHHVKKIYGFSEIVLVCKAKHECFADMFDAIDEAIVVSDVDMNHILDSALSYTNMFGPNYILGNLQLLQKIWRLYPNRLDPFKLAILQIPQYCEPALISDRFISASIDELQTKWTKSILIAPYANTLDHMPESFWESVVKGLIQRGYTVYCNAFGNEPTIAGTIRYEASLKEAYEMSLGCDGVISNRSGFSDVIAFNPDVKHIVINPTKDRADYDNVEIYGSKKIINLVWNENYEPLVREILKQFE